MLKVPAKKVSKENGLPPPTEKMLGRIKILGRKRSKWEPVLKENINQDQFPTQYGGTRMEDLKNNSKVL